MEKLSEIETAPSEGKLKLLQLEKEGKFVFHGSPVSDIEEFEPRQSFTIPRDQKEMVKDGEPAVFATPHSEIAIFRAIVNRGGRSGFGTYEDGTFDFSASEKVLANARETAYVYVFKKENFISRVGYEWMSLGPVKPIECIEVLKSDLPKNIKLIDEDSPA